MNHRDLNATFRPIDVWPGEMTKQRQRSRFKAGWSMTLDLLRTELRHLGAKDIVLQVALDEDEIRRDGYPRASARPDHPGVILAFESRFGPLRYPCDTFTTWQDNLRAIALALEALRKVDRYGVTKRGEQYTGWAKLPPAGGTSVTMTAEAAAAFLVAAEGRGGDAEDLLSGPHAAEAMRITYRNAAKRLHPDAGGSAREFAMLGTAKAVLEQHLGSNGKH